MDGNNSYDLVQEDALVMAAGTFTHPSNSAFKETSKEFKEEQ